MVFSHGDWGLPIKESTSVNLGKFQTCVSSSAQVLLLPNLPGSFWQVALCSTAISAVQIQTYQVPRRQQEISLNSDMHYKEGGTTTEQYKVVWYYTWVWDTIAWYVPMQHCQCAIPSMHRYCCKFTWYALGTYWEVDWVAGLQRHCKAAVWGHSYTEIWIIGIIRDFPLFHWHHQKFTYLEQRTYIMHPSTFAHWCDSQRDRTRQDTFLGAWGRASIIVTTMEYQFKIALFACRPASWTGLDRRLHPSRLAVSKSFNPVFDTF